MTIQNKRTKCEVWMRTMGYYRPISQMNTGKKAEACSRKTFNVVNSMNSRFLDQYSE